MSGGLGAGFATLTMLVVLAGLAALLGAVGIAAVGLERRAGRVPGWLRSVPAVLLVPVVAVGGFGVLALYDEAVVAAGLFLAVVIVPLGIEVGTGRRVGRSWLETFAIAGVSWCLPYLFGALAFFAVTIGAAELLELSPAATRGMGVAWVAMATSGVIVVVGSRLVSVRFAPVLVDA